MINCKICNKDLLQITTNHLKRHNLTVVEYKNQFPDSPLQDESIIMCGEKNPFYGKKHTKELKEWQRLHFIGKKCPIISEKISNLWKDENGVFRKLMASDKYKKIMSDSIKKYWNSDKSTNHRKKNSEILRLKRPLYEDKIREIQSSIEFRQKVSARVKLQHINRTPQEKNNIIVKINNTLIANGKGMKASKAENEFHSLLKEHFISVERWKWFWPSVTNATKMWNIDFYIPEISTYVQFDGVYWHGLDRPLEEIQLFKTKTDVSIYEKWKTDREQDKWFASSGLRLVRITDKEFKLNKLKCLERVQL